MTLLSPFYVLAAKWREEARELHENGNLLSSSIANDNANELTELLGKVVVTDEMVAKVTFDFLCAYWKSETPCITSRDREYMKDALESALGVTK